MENVIAISVTVDWSRGQDVFTDNRYSRAHRWIFDGGADVPASSSPHVVPVPMSDASAVDPEEAFVASISSCHMLWFLSIAAKKGLRVNRYVDNALGEMGKNPEGKIAMMTVQLRPLVDWDGLTPEDSVIADLHHTAHEKCFIANSVLTAVTIEPRK
jgi:organic hydroperoxide reductase OsmC/OhrA